MRTGDLDPLQWGWYLESGRLAPIMTDIQPAHADMMNIVRCKCRAMCSTMSCSCRKRGHSCFSAREHCHGNSCTNVRSVSAIQAQEDAAGCETCLDDVLYDSDFEWVMEETVDSSSVLTADSSSVLTAEVREFVAVKDRPVQLTTSCSRIQIETNVIKVSNSSVSVAHTLTHYVCCVQQVYVQLKTVKTALYKALYASSRVNFYLFNTICLFLTTFLVKLVCVYFTVN